MRILLGGLNNIKTVLLNLDLKLLKAFEHRFWTLTIFHTLKLKSNYFEWNILENFTSFQRVGDGYFSKQFFEQFFVRMIHLKISFFES